jgi:hypothetical protein
MLKIDRSVHLLSSYPSSAVSQRPPRTLISCGRGSVSTAVTGSDRERRARIAGNTAPAATKNVVIRTMPYRTALSASAAGTERRDHSGYAEHRAGLAGRDAMGRRGCVMFRAVTDSSTPATAQAVRAWTAS